MGPGVGHVYEKRYPVIWALRSGSNGGDQHREGLWLRAAPLLLMVVRSPELGRVRATAVPRSPGLARIIEEDSANTLVGFWPRDRDQRGENIGRVGVIRVRNSDHGERQSTAIGLG